jgi:VanZ family protein
MLDYKKNKNLLLAVAYLLLLFMTSILPMDWDMPKSRFIHTIVTVLTNLCHIPMFAILAFIWLQVLTYYQLKTFDKLAIVLTVSLILGIVYEIIQIAIPGRYSSIIDIGLNFIGVFLGISVYFIKEKRISRFAS